MEAYRLSYLLEQYHKGAISAAEREELDAWYETMQVTDDSFFAAGVQQEQEVSLLLQQLHERMPQTAERHLQKAVVKKIPVIRWAVAASLTIAAATGAWLISRKQPASLAVVRSSKMVLSDTLKEVIHKTNTGEADMQLVLEDGTLMVLSKQASVQYPAHFNRDKREVTIQGKVFFDVTKDKVRPFTVYAAHTATRVLGTAFTVQEWKEGVTVKLFNGKVQVSATDEVFAGWKQPVILHPGEQLHYNIQQASLAVTKLPAAIHEVQTGTARHSINSEDELVFENAALPKVFDSISKFYNISIQYEKAQIKALYFSGTMQKGDAPDVMLKAITQMNGLELQQTGNGYTIRVAE